MATDAEYSLPPELIQLEQSADGLFYVEDEEDGMYEIEAFLGDDVNPICQVFKAKYSSTSKKFTDYQSGHRRKGDEVHQVVALKLARVDDGSPDFISMKKEVLENSFTIGLNDDQENNVVTANNIILGIYKSFVYRELFCVSMPYLEGGSLRYIINEKRIPDFTLPEKCIAVVLREILKGVCFLHGREKVHTKLNAGNIFIGDFGNPFGIPVSIKLGYQGSTYFHNPESDCKKRIWDDSGDPRVLCVASNSEVNKFWTIRGIYEPSSRSKEQNYILKSDIWNLGVTALELAFGPFDDYGGFTSSKNLRTPDGFHTFLTELCNNEVTRLPDLYDLFLPDPNLRKAKEVTVSEKKSNVKKGMSNAGEKLKILAKKVELKIPCAKLPKTEDHPQKIIGDEWSEISDTNVKDDELSNSFTAMVKKCLVFDPDKRPTAEKLLNHPFFKKHENADLQYFRNSILRYLPIQPSDPYY